MTPERLLLTSLLAKPGEALYANAEVPQDEEEEEEDEDDEEEENEEDKEEIDEDEDEEDEEIPTE